MIAPGSKLGSYEVLSLLGAGGMGEVYRALDTRLGRVVAIKVPPAEKMADENRRRRFVQEARAASALNHPSIVTIHEIESAEGIDFIVMEYVEGKTLDSVLPRQRMKLGEVLRIAIPIADAVARAHAAGIVHRDLKPANVMAGSDGVVKVLDFGLAKLVTTFEPGGPDHETVSEDGGAGPLSRSGMVVGTAGYMSPEQAMGKEVDTRSDVFSFGAMLYEMVTGRRAFAGNSTAETLAAVVRDQPKAVSELVPTAPRDLEKLIQRCLRKEPDRRFQHMADVKVELQEIKEESESGQQASAAPDRRGRMTGLRIGLTGTVLALALGGSLIWRSRVRELRPPIAVPLTSTPGWATGPTFSPDGNQVAFAWNGEKQDNFDIYIKMVGSTETRRLTTDPAVDGSPIWSPDGRQIAFIGVRDGKAAIRLVSPLGGSDRKLSDQPVGGQLSWSADGRWLAAAAASAFDQGTSKAEGRGIQLIAVSDGTAHGVTFPSPLTYDSEPAFSPDGHHLAYASCHFGGLACHVDIVDLEADSVPNGASRRLTRSVLWGPGGLAFTRDGQTVLYGDYRDARLWRVGIAGDRPPQRIEVAGNATWPAVSVSRDRLAFERAVARRETYQFEAGRPTKLVAASSWPSVDTNPDFSPDGRRFAFQSGRGGEGNEIWLAAADGSNPMQLTHGPGQWQGSPRWSPDGARIAFDSQDKEGHWGIWTVNVDGGSLRCLTSAPDNNLPSWSRDGRSVYFASDRTGAFNVWRVPAGGGVEEQITRTGGWRPSESIDGKTLFFQGRGESPLLALPVGGGRQRKVIDCVADSDGFTVGAAGVYHLGCRVADADTPTPLYLLNPATGQDGLVGKLERWAGGLTVSPEGKTFLYTKGSEVNADLIMIEDFR